MRGGDRLIIALDAPSLREAERVAKRLQDVVRYVKIGSALFTAEGPRAVARMQALGFKVFLDLKFHDIPSTVEKSCRAAVRLGAAMVTVHASGGAAMLQAAAFGARDEARRRGQPGPLVLGVTVLTSDGGASRATQAQVLRLAKDAQAAGVGGVVASAREAAVIRRQVGRRLRIVCPGIRPVGAEPADQRRVATPAEAIRHGADFLVVGRPVTAATDPRAAAAQMIREMEAS